MSSESQRQLRKPEHHPGHGQGSGAPGLLEMGQLQWWTLNANPRTLVLLAQKAGRCSCLGRQRGWRKGTVGWGGLGGWSAREPGAWGGGVARGSVTASRRQSFPYSAPPPPAGILSGKGKGGGEQRCPSDGGRRGRQTDRHTDQQCSPRVHPPTPPDSHTLLVVTGAQRPPRSPMWSGGGGKARGWEAAAGGRSSPGRLR